MSVLDDNILDHKVIETSGAPIAFKWIHLITNDVPDEICTEVSNAIIKKFCECEVAIWPTDFCSCTKHILAKYDGRFHFWSQVKNWRRARISEMLNYGYINVPDYVFYFNDQPIFQITTPNRLPKFDNRFRQLFCRI